MTDFDRQLRVLSRGLDQAHRLLGDVTPGWLTVSTPCEEWTLADLVDHMVMAPAKFAEVVRGGSVDWGAPAPNVRGAPADAFREAAEELLAAWRQTSDGPVMGPDWQSAEIAVHTYDLARAMGRPTGDLDAEVAERGLAFMQANLKSEMRAEAFGPEQAAPTGADPYQRVAAFAGRHL